MIEETMKGWPFAVVYLKDKIGTDIAVPATFCYDTPDGFAFVEPGYMDPYSGRSCFHRIVATVYQDSEAFTFDGPEWSGRVEQYEPTAAQLERIGYALEQFEEAHQEAGLNLDAERERVKGLVGFDLS